MRREAAAGQAAASRRPLSSPLPGPRWSHVRRYASGQELLVRNSGEWVEAVVDVDEAVRIGGTPITAILSQELRKPLPIFYLELKVIG